MCSTFSKATKTFDFIKPNLIRKLANKVKYISQINRGLIMFFWKFKNIFLNYSSWLDCKQYGKNQHAVFKAL